METRKLKALMIILVSFVASSSYAATLTDTIGVSSMFKNNYFVQDEGLKYSKLYDIGWNKDWDNEEIHIKDIFKMANLSISSFDYEQSLDEIDSSLKVQKDNTAKSKYWIFMLTKSSLSIGSEVLPASILTAMALPVLNVVRLCSRGLTVSTLSSYPKRVGKRILNRHSRFLCR